MTRSISGLAGRVFLWQRVNQAVYLARNIVLARYIVPSDYGDFAAALNLASYVAIASAIEFRTAFFSKPDLGEDATRTQWSCEVLLNTISLLLGLALVPLLGGRYPPSVLIAMVGLLVVGVVEASYSTHLYLVEKQMLFPFLTSLRTVVNLASFAGCLAFAVAGWGWKALLIDRVATAAMLAVALWARTGWRPSLRLHRPSLAWYWGFVSVMFLNALWGKVLFGFDIFAITRRLGAEATGLYNMAMKWALIPMELGAGFLAVMALSLYSKERARGPDAIRAAYGEVTFHIVRFSIAIAVLMAIFMQDFFRLAYGPEWRGVPAVFLALVPYAIWRPLYQNVCQGLQALQRLWTIFWVMCLQGVVALVALWWLAPRGLVPAALAAGGAIGLGHVLLEWRIWRETRYPLGFIYLPPMLLAGGAVALRFAAEEAMPLAAKVALAATYTTFAAWEWLAGRRRFHHAASMG
ncbi:MAG: oligosaccharide flippase family protein [Verrucomicrobiae bacterium]|nr:oligosaccharide flippase family protein [Verrucomicrobiae bacterium]